VSSRWSSVALGLLLLAGCNREKEPAAAPRVEKSPAAEAAVLGGEIFDVIDQVMSFRSAHGGQWPRTLREVGVDSLTRSTIRRLSFPGGDPVVTALFRSAQGRQVAACRGGSGIQEEASLNGGVFTVSCSLTGGGVSDFKVQGTR
jgi:hypothetical protein